MFLIVYLIYQKLKIAKKVMILTPEDVEDKSQKILESQEKMELKRLQLDARIYSLKAQKLRSDADLFKLKLTPTI